MRRIITWTIGLVPVGVAVATGFAVLVTQRALAAAQVVPPALCLERHRAMEAAAGTLPMAEKDRLVAESANFALGANMGPRWHVREAEIALAYRSFWPEAKRNAIFGRIASKMRPCPPRPGRPRPTHSSDASHG